MAHVQAVTRASDGRLVWYAPSGLDRTRVVFFPPGAKYLDALGRTRVVDATGHAGTDVFWNEYEDHRRPGKDEWSGWDESAEEGPDEGRPYVGRGTGIPYDQHFDNPNTGPYPGWPPARAEPDPRDLYPSASWRTIRKTASADPNPLLGLGCGGGCMRGLGAVMKTVKHVGSYQPQVPGWIGVVFTAETGWPNRIIVFTNGIAVMSVWRVGGWTAARAVYNLAPTFSAALPIERDKLTWLQWRPAAQHNMVAYRWAQSQGFTVN